MKLKTEDIFEFIQYINEWPPSNLLEAIEWLKEKAAGLSKEATIGFSYVDVHGSYYSSIEIRNPRLETQEEMEIRLRKEEASKLEEFKKALKTIEEFQKKYNL
jgi:hypothetical protein